MMADVWPHLLTLLGAGGLQAIILKIVDARREKQAQESEKQAQDGDLAKRAFDAFESEREDTQRHVHELVTCERRCAALERDVRTLTEQRDALVHRVSVLEREVALMRLAVDSVLAGERPSSTIAAVAPIGRR